MMIVIFKEILLLKLECIGLGISYNRLSKI